MTINQAEQVAALLNERNELTVRYTGQRLLDSAADFLCRVSPSGDVIACVEVKRLQWYQTEVLHLTVSAAHERQGHAQALLREAERQARCTNARLLQCTIRENNAASCGLFERLGFKHVSTFHNENSGNSVLVLQKVLTGIE